jgi:hypothetical protein
MSSLGGKAGFVNRSSGSLQVYFGFQPAKVLHVAVGAAQASRKNALARAASYTKWKEEMPCLCCSKNLLISTWRCSVKKRHGLGPAVSATGMPSIGDRYGNASRELRSALVGSECEGCAVKGNRKFFQRGVAGCGPPPAVTGYGQVKWCYV